jgi:uncharacterized membrane protein YbhN (UPF0104 family)
LTGPARDERHAPDPSPELLRFRRWLRLVLGGASLVFVVYAGYRLLGQWQSGKVTLSLPPLALSMLPLAVGTLVLAIGWKWLLERMTSREIPLRPAVLLHLESQLARYTPGKVGMPLVRIAGAAQLGAPAGAVASSVLIELLPFLSVGGAVGFLCLWVGIEKADGALAFMGRWGVLGLGVFAAVTAVLAFVDRRRYPTRFLELLRVRGDAALVPLRVPLAHAAYWLTWALHGYFASRSVGASHEAALAGTGFYVLAPIAGFLALATPSGIGVREAVLSMGLSPVMGAAPAIAAAIVSRLTSLVVDVLAWGAARVLVRRNWRSGPG